MAVSDDRLLLWSASAAEAVTVACRKGPTRKRPSACTFSRMERAQVVTVKAGVFGHLNLEFGK